MGFKDMVAADRLSVFLSTSFFGDAHTVNGKEMDVVVDENELLERDKARLGVNQDGLYNVRKLVYVSAEQYGPKPAVNSILTLDGKKYHVVSCTDECGIYAIELKAVRT